MGESQTVTSAELIRRFGRWQDHAALKPLFVTHHGRERLVMLSMDRYRALAEAGGGDTSQSSDSDPLRLATLQDQMSQAFVAFDRDLRVTHANGIACSHLGRARTDLVGRELDEEIADLGRSVARIHIARTVRSGEVSAFDAPSLSYPGTWLHSRTFPYGEGVGCLFRNVSGEREMHRLHAELVALREALAEHRGVGLAILSPRAAFVEVDALFAQMAGFDPAGLLHVRLTDIMPLAERVHAAEHVERVLSAGGGAAFDGAILVNRGERLPVRFSIAARIGDLGIEGATLVMTPR